MNLELLNPEVQDFINEHLERDPVQLLLKPSPFPQVSMQEIAEQIQGKRKCRQKLPQWYRTRGIYYPPSLALEQCSSSLTGAYKASLCAGDTLADLTGGAGADSYFFSKNFRKVIHIELSAHLSATAAHNLPLLGAGNIRFICGDGMEFLRKTAQGQTQPASQTEQAAQSLSQAGQAAQPLSQAGQAAQPGQAQQEAMPDCIYLDPSRRTRNNKKVFLPSDYEPDFIPSLDLLVSAARQVIIKTSPLIDLRFGLKAFRFVRELHVVAVKNECKEILWILGKEPLPDPLITCATLREEYTNRFDFRLSMEENAAPAPLSNPLTYLYEPGAALLKAGAFKTLGIHFGLAKLHANSHLYTSEDLVEQFPGRSFRLTGRMAVREFGQRFKGKRLHISTRNFPESTPALLKKYSITEGGTGYAFFTTLQNGKRVVLLCEKI
ncbi:THUMP-like domain-containing protein [Anseongella ginsenosidimutans]|uniref:THUMP-like domain-containing protein n=1 Tax=Anseongella ginsenosidimutans TaxID=496056 RepID=UPI0010484A95|nr:class I SAM-dependent methyltransferase [Anseongella ginsenosidimutans]QEC53475.1 class I SAM-dependent methyltransferase [Anseongella ginsenosidimutans]